ncbi:hypothetical protein [Paracoccus lutimaris]|uniref:Uncharacterized protein n=1 Tax=Paracoccus lutimaris TaxID=1490030 RepID=A0A368YBR0_9RHOB|nr:hypothetical protein [Paracoccus lutimaris]RCW77691.1 hypothetical protein DFP89_16210 [Paracoccus lutimaris]
MHEALFGGPEGPRAEPGQFRPLLDGQTAEHREDVEDQKPIVNLMAEEATEKLGAAVAIDVVRPMQAYDHGGKARAVSTMLQAMATAKEAGLDPATVKDALQFIDWAD